MHRNIRGFENRSDTSKSNFPQCSSLNTLTVDIANIIIATMSWQVRQGSIRANNGGSEYKSTTHAQAGHIDQVRKLIEAVEIESLYIGRTERREGRKVERGNRTLIILSMCARGSLFTSLEEQIRRVCGLRMNHATKGLHARSTSRKTHT